jgi:hypothetical protein
VTGIEFLYTLFQVTSNKVGTRLTVTFMLMLVRTLCWKKLTRSSKGLSGKQCSVIDAAKSIDNHVRDDSMNEALIFHL